MPDPTDDDLIAEWRRLNQPATDDEWRVQKDSARCDFLMLHSTRLLALVERLMEQRDNARRGLLNAIGECDRLRQQLAASQGGGE